jgi:hypothetical protein
MAFDAANGQTVLFGGFVRDASNGCVMNDTWTWDVSLFGPMFFPSRREVALHAPR